MTQFDKLIARILARPPEAEFSDVRRVLEAYGWTLARQRGSHVSFTKRGERHIIVATTTGGRKVKRTCVTRVINRLGLNE